MVKSVEPVACLLILLMIFHKAAISPHYSLLAKWYDKEASIVRNFYLLFYIEDNTVALYDVDRKQNFLKRMFLDEVSVCHLHVGSKIRILSRYFTIIDYVDEYTRKHLEFSNQKTYVMIKPDAFNKCGEILDFIIQNNFYISQLKMIKLTESIVLEFYKEHLGKPFIPSLIQYITSGPSLAMELIGNDAVKRFRELLGPTDSEKARESAPGSLRARFGTNTQKNAAHASAALSDAERELNIFFPQTLNKTDTDITSLTATPSPNSTLCLVKPHTIRKENLGKIVDEIQKSGLTISAMQMFIIETEEATKFFEVYEGVSVDYRGMVDELSSGPCVAIAVAHETEDAYSKLKDLVGPRDPAVAKRLHPNSIRAKYGEDKIMNAVHCTDLDEDVMTEIDYFFTRNSKVAN